MSFRWKSFADVAIDDLIDTILDELMANGYIEIDPGYKVVKNPNGNFVFGLSLEATNKRYLQCRVGEIGMYDTGTHAWNNDEHQYGHLLADMASSFPTGTEEGVVKMSYDENGVIIITDYTSAGGDYRRCCSFGGLADPLSLSDVCLTFGSSLFRGTNAVPNNTVTTSPRTKIMRTISGGMPGNMYFATFLIPDGANGMSNGAPRMLLLSATVDKRLLPYIYLSAENTYGYENAGIRCTIPSMFVGGSKDAEPYGAIIRTTDGKEYFYFIQDTTYTYCHFATRLLVRCA